jgi:hypothetical protein
MTTQIAVSKTLSIRDCGYDEHWLQDRIAEDPGILRLGDLEVVRRERQQSSGGKLDILLKDAEDDTINVVQLLSLSIPIIAVQANVIEANGARILHFARILDAYEEPEDGASAPEEACDEAWWRARSTSNLETAKALLKIVSPVYGRMELGYARYWIALKKENDFFNQFSLKPRRGNKSLASFWVNDSDVDAVSSAFDQKGVLFTRKKASKGTTQFVLTLDQQLLEGNTDLFQRVAEFVKKCQ